MAYNRKEEMDYEEYESLKQSRFKQQKIPGWRILPSMFHAILYFFSIGILCLGLGIALILVSEENIFKEEFFHNNTYVIFNITKKMKADIMVYYKVYNYYQNNRRYISSKSFDQLYGENITLNDMKKRHDCDPLITNKDMEINESIFNISLKQDELAIPCGLMAKSFKLFNNSYIFEYIDGPNFNENSSNNIEINTTNIARKFDREKYNNSFNITNQWLDLKDEHFMVWMRPAPFANFSKLYGRINQDIEKGNVIKVTMQPGKYFDKEEYNKSGVNLSIILTTTNYFGGENKNKELSFAFAGFGLLCIIFGIVFIVAFKCNNKKDK